MIETAEALENLQDIVTTPGVDGVYVGPSDLALALGLPRDRRQQSSEARRGRRAHSRCVRRSRHRDRYPHVERRIHAPLSGGGIPVRHARQRRRLHEPRGERRPAREHADTCERRSERSSKRPATERPRRSPSGGRSGARPRAGLRFETACSAPALRPGRCVRALSALSA